MTDYRGKLRSHRRTDLPSNSPQRKAQKLIAEDDDISSLTNNSQPTDTGNNTNSIPASDDTNATGTAATAAGATPSSPKTPPLRPKPDLAALFPPSPHNRKRYEFAGDRYMTFSNSGNKTPSSSLHYQHSPTKPWQSRSRNNDNVPTFDLMSEEEMDPMTNTRNLIYASELSNSESDFLLRNPFLEDDDDDDDQAVMNSHSSLEEGVLRFVAPSTSLRSNSNNKNNNETDTSNQQQRRRPYVFTVSNDTQSIQNVSPTLSPSHNSDAMDTMLPSPPQYDTMGDRTEINYHGSVSPVSPTRSAKLRTSYSPTRPAASPSVSSSTPATTSSSFPTIPDPNSRRFSTSLFSDGFKDMITSNNSRRKISSSPVKILDAPDLADDFYLNLLHWGPNGCVAVGLGTCVYIWNANTSIVTKLVDLGNRKVTSVGWNSSNTHLLAVGVDDGRTLLYDAEKTDLIRTWSNHTTRVGSLDWTNNVLSTGGRDHFIYHHDIRSSDPYSGKLTGHGAEVCGIKWSPDSNQLATGGNDNQLLIWDARESNPLHTFRQHKAAVKAIAWSPSRRGVLCSGGGTADKTIKFWNTFEGSLLRSYNIGSQVCNLAWLKGTDELVSTHGYADGAGKLCNQVYVWRPENMRRVATLSGHRSRVLYMSISPDETTVVTGAHDDTLRFWDIGSTEKEGHVLMPRASSNELDEFR